MKKHIMIRALNFLEYLNTQTSTSVSRYTPLADVDGKHTEVEPELAANQHYKKCHLDKWENKAGRCRELAKEAESDDTMLRFKDLLLERAQEQWKKLNLG